MSHVGCRLMVASRAKIRRPEARGDEGPISRTCARNSATAVGEDVGDDVGEDVATEDAAFRKSVVFLLLMP